MEDPIDDAILGPQGRLVERLDEVDLILGRVDEPEELHAALRSEALGDVDIDLRDLLASVAPHIAALDRDDDRVKPVVSRVANGLAELVHAFPHRQAGRLAGLGVTSSLVAYAQIAGLQIAPRTTIERLGRLEIHCTADPATDMLPKHLNAYLRRRHDGWRGWWQRRPGS